MSKVIFKAKAMQFQNGCLLLPATTADKKILDQFCNELGSRYASVTANFSRCNKSYDQVKTIFALINIRFFIQYHRYPTDTEKAIMYSGFLWKYADKVSNPLNPDEEIPVPLSEMSKTQAAYFINSIIGDIYEYAGSAMTDTQQVELKQLFEEFQAANGYGIDNPTDYDKDGNLLSEDEWREKNHFSFASGVDTEDLQLHHILSRGAHKAYEHCPWNWIMLTEEEHMRIIHAMGGWKKFISIFPHTAPRIKNAYDMAHEMYPREIQEAFIEIGLIDKNSNEITEEVKEEPSFDNMKPVTEKSSETEPLAIQALKSAGLVDEDAPYEGDIF